MTASGPCSGLRSCLSDNPAPSVEHGESHGNDIPGWEGDEGRAAAPRQGCQAAARASLGHLTIAIRNRLRACRACPHREADGRELGEDQRPRRPWIDEGGGRASWIAARRDYPCR